MGTVIGILVVGFIVIKMIPIMAESSRGNKLINMYDVASKKYGKYVGGHTGYIIRGPKNFDSYQDYKGFWSLCIALEEYYLTNNRTYDMRSRGYNFLENNPDMESEELREYFRTKQ